MTSLKSFITEHTIIALLTFLGILITAICALIGTIIVARSGELAAAERIISATETAAMKSMLSSEDISKSEPSYTPSPLPASSDTPTPTPTSSPTDEPPSPTNTPLPSDTPSSTPTLPPPTPTPLPTDTPTTSPTSTPTNTPIPEVRLEVGQSWEEEGVILTVQWVKFNEKGFIDMGVLFENESGGQVAFSWDETNVSLVDNLGNWYEQPWCNEDEIVLGHGESYPIHSCNGSRDALFFQPNTTFFNSDVTEMTLTFRKLSRIDQVKWRIVVPH